MSLTRLGKMEVFAVGDPAEALDVARRERPDAILLDVMMPEIDGPALLAQLRDEPSLSDIPVIFLTANAMPGEVDRLRRLGAAGVLTKPFDPVAFPGDIVRIVSPHALHNAG